MEITYVYYDYIFDVIFDVYAYEHELLAKGTCLTSCTLAEDLYYMYLGEL